jgi:hypothetical protein
MSQKNLTKKNYSLAVAELFIILNIEAAFWGSHLTRSSDRIDDKTACFYEEFKTT